MSKLEVVDRLKVQRSKIRKKIIKSVQEEIVRTAEGGHFPDFESMVKQIMFTISQHMEEKPEIPIEEWIIVLQEKEPDKYCKKTMAIVEGTWQGK